MYLLQLRPTRFETGNGARHRLRRGSVPPSLRRARLASGGHRAVEVRRRCRSTAGIHGSDLTGRGSRLSIEHLRSRHDVPLPRALRSPPGRDRALARGIETGRSDGDRAVQLRLARPPILRCRVAPSGDPSPSLSLHPTGALPTPEALRSNLGGRVLSQRSRRAPVGDGEPRTLREPHSAPRITPRAWIPAIPARHRRTSHADLCPRTARYGPVDAIVVLGPVPSPGTGRFVTNALARWNRQLRAPAPWSFRSDLISPREDLRDHRDSERSGSIFRPAALEMRRHPLANAINTLEG